MIWLHFTVLFLAFGVYSFSIKSDYLENDNKDFAADSSGFSIEFHEIHGKDIVLSRQGTVATRTEGYCLGMTFTKRPVKVNERIYVKILKTTSSWPGRLQIGFTAKDPSTLQSLMSECLSPQQLKKTWAEKVDAIYASEKSLFSYYVDEKGAVHYGQLDEDKILFEGVDTRSDLWAVLYVYGETVSIQLSGNSSNILSVPGVEASREKGISYLMSLRNTESGWTEDTRRAIVALYLSGAATFNGTDMEQQLMIKELEMETYLALSKKSSVPLSASELALYINALLVTCHNPRNFHGFDLIALLKNEIPWRANVHPFVYLALCNANEPMSSDAVSFLKTVLESDSKYLFWTDFRAMAVMALVCNIRRNGNSNNEEKTITSSLNGFTQLQRPDGGFGSIYTSALVVQALLAGAHISYPEWDAYNAVSYFLAKQNSTSDGQSFADFTATYLIVPILNENSLVDVGHVKCPNAKGSNVSVRYSLCFGENMETAHSTSLNVPPNITVLDVMHLAAKEYPKFKFLYEMVSNKMYVYSIGNIANDSESGMFWLLYLSKTKNENAVFREESPDTISLSGGEHVIMWYKKAAV